MPVAARSMLKTGVTVSAGGREGGLNKLAKRRMGEGGGGGKRHLRAYSMKSSSGAPSCRTSFRTECVQKVVFNGSGMPWLCGRRV